MQILRSVYWYRAHAAPDIWFLGNLVGSMTQSLVGGAERLRACMDVILRNYQDEQLRSDVRAEVDYLIACSASDCAADEMREYIHSVLDPSNSAMVDHRIVSVIIRGMVDALTM